MKIICKLSLPICIEHVTCTRAGKRAIKAVDLLNLFNRFLNFQWRVRPPPLQGFSLCKELLAADQGEKRGEKMVGGGGVGGMLKKRGNIYCIYIK